MIRKTVVGAMLALSVSFSSAVVLAHGGATGVVKERMDLMVEMKESMKSLSAMFKGTVPYDAQAVRDAAAVIRDYSGAAMTRLFPEGSLHGPSEAKADIWREWERFQALAERLQRLGQGLYDAADNGRGGSGPGMGSMMGGADMMMGGSMMGGGHMMGHGHMMDNGMPAPEHLAQMPADRVFKMLTDTCSSCHTRYRKEP